jgi:hypothetical protein
MFFVSTRLRIRGRAIVELFIIGWLTFTHSYFNHKTLCNIWDYFLNIQNRMTNVHTFSFYPYLLLSLQADFGPVQALEIVLKEKTALWNYIFFELILLKSNLLVSLWIFRPTFHEICCSSSFLVAFGYKKCKYTGQTKAILNSHICRRIAKPVWHIEFSFHMLAFSLKWSVFRGGNAGMSWLFENAVSLFG